VIQHIDPVPKEDVSRNTFCIFLITPSFASWLANDETFLAKAVHHAYSNALAEASQSLEIQALCAVVDKLPAGKTLKAGVTIEDKVARIDIQAHAEGEGFEGVAFATLPAMASVSSRSPKSPDKGAIDFIVSEKNPVYRDTWRLPLANTVFQTGMPTTMFLSTWKLDFKTETLALNEKLNITHHGVQMSAFDMPSHQTHSVLRIPLVPLTDPRVVEGCMGNIIRRVIGPEKESMTASSELEKVVPQFFKARGEAAQPTTAWALVIPKNISKRQQVKTSQILSRQLADKERGTHMTEVLWERLWRQGVGRNALVTDALTKGARLHRILSGGGGWGKKAGLLSLDPVPVSEEVPIRMEDATSTFDGPGDFSSALTPVVKDGEAIQFFISPAPRRPAEEHKALELLKSLPKEGSGGLELGTVPSTIDSIPGGSWQQVGPNLGYLTVFKNSFGALTEGGLTLTQHCLKPPQKEVVTLSTMKIDVPYSRFWSVEQVDGEDMTNDVGGKKSDSQESRPHSDSRGS
jgi:hypothetical protein